MLKFLKNWIDTISGKARIRAEQLDRPLLRSVGLVPGHKATAAEDEHLRKVLGQLGEVDMPLDVWRRYYWIYDAVKWTVLREDLAGDITMLLTGRVNFETMEEVKAYLKSHRAERRSLAKLARQLYAGNMDRLRRAPDVPVLVIGLSEEATAVPAACYKELVLSVLAGMGRRRRKIIRAGFAVMGPDAEEVGNITVAFEIAELIYPEEYKKARGTPQEEKQGFARLMEVARARDAAEGANSGQA